MNCGGGEREVGRKGVGLTLGRRWGAVVEIGVGAGCGCWVGRVGVGVEELGCRGISWYGSNSVVIGLGGADGCGGCSRLYRASWSSINRLIFSQSSCRDGVWAACDSAGGLVVAAVPLGRGAAPGVAVPDGVGVSWGVGGRSSRGAAWGVEVVVGAVCFVVP